MDGQSQPLEVADTTDSNYAHGRTVISDTAIAKVVGVAARGVAGVHALGSGASRSLGAIRDVVGATDLTQGIRVEVGESQIAVDIVLMAEYGFPLHHLASTVREAVYAAVEELVGRRVIEVNIEITDVYVPAAESEKSRARLAGLGGSVNKQAVTPIEQAVIPIDLEVEP